ncbi:ER membrane protein complex subunit 8-like [Tubulanus polymorphus]|uniref:ER membrane protein complex subunit 8-like n=1 Tax=Tubulanus polymorphus TaxID=672921 RepID=UPI003DA57D7E
MDVAVNTRAYCKMLLHAAKYPHCSVNGLLLSQKSKEKETKHLNFVDCIPLFHLSLTLAPMLEVALAQIDSYCKSKGLCISGYYQANEYLGDASPTIVSYKVADRISENSGSGESLIVMLDNRKLSFECEEPAHRIHRYHDGKWKQLPHESSQNMETGCLAAASALIQSKTYEQLTDFDNYLDDITQDWQNLWINEQLKNLA